MLIRVPDASFVMLSKKGDLRGGGEGEAYSASGWMGNHGNICSGLEVHVRAFQLENKQQILSEMYMHSFEGKVYVQATAK